MTARLQNAAEHSGPIREMQQSMHELQTELQTHKILLQKQAKQLANLADALQEEKLFERRQHVGREPPHEDTDAAATQGMSTNAPASRTANAQASPDQLSQVLDALACPPCRFGLSALVLGLSMPYFVRAGWLAIFHLFLACAGAVLLLPPKALAMGSLDVHDATCSDSTNVARHLSVAGVLLALSVPLFFVFGFGLPLLGVCFAGWLVLPDKHIADASQHFVACFPRIRLLFVEIARLHQALRGSQILCTSQLSLGVDWSTVLLVITGYTTIVGILQGSAAFAVVVLMLGGCMLTVQLSDLSKAAQGLGRPVVSCGQADAATFSAPTVHVDSAHSNELETLRCDIKAATEQMKLDAKSFHVAADHPLHPILLEIARCATNAEILKEQLHARENELHASKQSNGDLRRLLAGAGIKNAAAVIARRRDQINHDQPAASYALENKLQPTDKEKVGLTSQELSKENAVASDILADQQRGTTCDEDDFEVTLEDLCRRARREAIMHSDDHDRTAGRDSVNDDRELDRPEEIDNSFAHAVAPKSPEAGPCAISNTPEHCPGEAVGNCKEVSSAHSARVLSQQNLNKAWLTSASDTKAEKNFPEGYIVTCTKDGCVSDKHCQTRMKAPKSCAALTCYRCGTRILASEYPGLNADADSTGKEGLSAQNQAPDANLQPLDDANTAAGMNASLFDGETYTQETEDQLLLTEVTNNQEKLLAENLSQLGELFPDLSTARLLAELERQGGNIDHTATALLDKSFV
eukprot:SAG31_NODE_2151_length_6325_cov_2.165275_3_plen_754_part_00